MNHTNNSSTLPLTNNNNNSIGRFFNINQPVFPNVANNILYNDDETKKLSSSIYDRRKKNSGGDYYDEDYSEGLLTADSESDEDGGDYGPVRRVSNVSFDTPFFSIDEITPSGTGSEEGEHGYLGDSSRGMQRNISGYTSKGVSEIDIADQAEQILSQQQNKGANIFCLKTSIRSSKSGDVSPLDDYISIFK